MVPEHIRKDFHRYGVPGDGPMGIKNVTQAAIADSRSQIRGCVSLLELRIKELCNASLSKFIFMKLWRMCHC